MSDKVVIIFVVREYNELMKLASPALFSPSPIGQALANFKVWKITILSPIYGV